MRREELIQLILAARTDTELDAAEKQAAAWLDQYPDNYGIAMALEQVGMIRLGKEKGND